MDNFNCGRLFLTGISGTTLTTSESNFIRDNNLAGVILFSKNYENKSQLKELIDSIQSLSSQRKIIAVDQEGGRVQRFKKDFMDIPSAKEIAEKNSPTFCFETYEKVAEELFNVGVNLNLAPCSDILTNPDCNVIGDRSFGEESKNVSRFVRAAIRGLQTKGVMACSKHFPGHGDTIIDSHDELPRSERSLELFEEEDLMVFKTAIKNKVSFMMMAHLIVPELDSELPVSLSEIAHEYLLNKLKFNGVVISDDMEMGAITKNFDPLSAATHALKAGTHLLEYRTFEACSQVVNQMNEKCLVDPGMRAIVEERMIDFKIRLNKFFL